MTTDKQILELAAKGYETIVPAQNDSDRCVLGAACFAKTGNFRSELRANFSKIFHRSDDFLAGVISGFDGDRPFLQNSKRRRERYKKGFKLGKKAAKKFLPKYNFFFFEVLRNVSQTQ